MSMTVMLQETVVALYLDLVKVACKHEEWLCRGGVFEGRDSAVSCQRTV